MATELTPQPGMRASDADRDATAQRLATALSEGRLDLAEYDHRLNAALAATTIGDLVPITADLPAPGGAAGPAADSGPVDLAAHAPAAPASEWRKWFDEWRHWLGGSVIMIGIWGTTSFASGELQPFWPLIPIGIWAAVIAAMVFFPGDD